MTALAATLDEKLTHWNPETARAVEAIVNEIILMADQDMLDLGRTRTVEQEVLDLLDEPQTR